MKHILLSVLLLCVIYQMNGQKNIASADNIDNTQELRMHYIHEMDKIFNPLFEEINETGKSTKGTGLNPYLRQKFDFLRHYRTDGSLESISRFDLLKQIRQQNLSRSTTSHVPAWESIGPDPIGTGVKRNGRVISIEFDPVDQNIVWLGSAEGGLWKSDDLGEEWKPMTDDLPVLSVSAIAINPANPDVMLIGTGEGKSTAPWVLTLEPGQGVFRSTDKGVQWETTSFTVSDYDNISIFDMKWRPLSDVVYLAASNGFWRSEDAGQNWSLIKSGRCVAIDFNGQNPDIVFAVFQSDGIYRSLNQGRAGSWQLISNGLPSGVPVGNSSLHINKKNPQVMYVSITDDSPTVSTWPLLGLYKSTDGGESWAILTLPFDYTCQPTNPNCQGWYNNVIYTSPYDENEIYLGGVTFWRSKDAGITWSQHDGNANGFTEGTTYVDMHGVAYSPHDSTMVFSLCDGGVYRSEDNGITWQAKNNKLSIGQFYSIASSQSDPNFIIGGTQDHGMHSMQIDQRGLASFRWAGSDGIATAIDPVNDSLVWGTLIGGQIVLNFTKAVGQTYVITGIAEAGQLFTPLITDPSGSGDIYFALSQNIYKMNDQFEETIIANIPLASSLAISPSNTQVIYASNFSYSAGTHSFFHTQDGGLTWTESNVSPGFRVTDIEVHPTQENVVFATHNDLMAGGSHILKSENFGDTWADITGNFPDITCNAILINPLNPQFIYVATDLGVFYTENNGQDWIEFNDDLPPCYSMDLNYCLADSTLRVGTHSRGIWRTKAIPSEINSSTRELFQNNNLSIYPNPSQGHTVNISFNSTKQINGEIVLYNHLGQKVSHVYSGKFLVGKNSIVYNLTNFNGVRLSPGLYVFQIKGNGMSINKKFIIQ